MHIHIHTHTLFRSLFLISLLVISVRFLAPPTITYGYTSSRPLGEVVELVVGLVAAVAKVFEKVARSGTTRSRHRDHGQPLIYILSTVEPASRLFVLECLPRARRGRPSLSVTARDALARSLLRW